VERGIEGKREKWEEREREMGGEREIGEIEREREREGEEIRGGRPVLEG